MSDFDWVERFVAWAEGDEDELDFQQAVVPARVQRILEESWMYRGLCE